MTARRRTIAVLVALAICASACQGDKEPSADLAKQPSSPLDPAVTLRVTFEALMREIVYQTGAATEAMLTSNKKTYGAAGDALDAPAVALAKQFASIFPGDTEKKALPAIRGLGGAVIEYALVMKPIASKNKKVIAKHKARQAKILGKMKQAAGVFAGFVSDLSPVLLRGKLTGEVVKVFDLMRVVVDKQLKKDFNGATAALPPAAAQMGGLALTIASSIADELPAQFNGDIGGQPAAFRSRLDALLKEYVLFVGLASQDQLSGFAAGFTAARAALDANGAALSAAIGSFYGADVEKAFQPLWQRHVELLVTYLTGTKDKAKQDKAVQDLTQYASDFGTFLAGANAELKASDMTKLMSDHLTEVKAFIDLHIAGKFAEAVPGVHGAADHMDALASAISQATVTMFPKKFVV